MMEERQRVKLPELISGELSQAIVQAIDRLREKFEPIDKLNFRNYSVSANADIPNIPIEPSHPPCLFRIMAAFSVGGVLSVVIRTGLDTEVLKLFEGSTLIADSLYICDVNVHRGDRITLRYGVDVTIRVMKVQEISRGV